MKISPWLVNCFMLDWLLFFRVLFNAYVCSIVDKMLFVLHGRLRLLYYSQPEAAAMKPKALVRISVAAGFDLCAVSPVSSTSA